MNIEQQGGGGLAPETMTITVSREFATNTRELSALFGYGDGETGEALEAIAGWWLQALREDDGELIATAESHLWRSEAACRAFAGRLQQKMPEVKVNVYEEPLECRDHASWHDPARLAARGQLVPACL